MEEKLVRVASSAPRWAALPPGERIRYLQQCLVGVASVAPAWVADVCRIKGAGAGDELAGEEWIAGPVPVARNIRLLIDALRWGGCPDPVSLTTRRNGQYVATILPTSARERILLSGLTGEVWIAPGRPPSQAAFYREPHPRSALSVVLGAGNAASIPLMDVLHKLFVEGSVVVLKMHPLLVSLGPLFERAFECLIDDGFFAVVHGDAATGAALVSHPLVAAVHLTGSAETYERIVFGPDPVDRAARKKADAPLNTRSISAELGCVTPVIVVPGAWRPDELDFQARQVASMVVHNASHNCTSAQVLVTASGWEQRRDFLALLRTRLSECPPRTAFYPGAEARYCAFIERFPRAQQLSPRADRVVPWTLLEGCSPDEDDFCFRNELFCGVLAEVCLDASAPDAFLASAVPFANERCWGTLSCVLLADDDTRERFATSLDRAIEALRYGAVGVNVWTSVVFGLASPPWGSFPHGSRTDIQSGTGFVHNTFMFDHPQKAVVRAPFRISPTPPWFVDRGHLRSLGERLFEHEVNPTFGRFLRVAWTALGG